MTPLLTGCNHCNHLGAWLPLDSGSWFMPTTNYAYTHIHWMCCNSVMIHSVHMSSILLSILERDPPLLLSWRVLPLFPLKGFFLFFGEFFLIRCEVKGQGCRMCTDCKALWGEFVICDIGLYQINCIELMNRLYDEDSDGQNAERNQRLSTSRWVTARPLLTQHAVWQMLL